MKKYIRCIAQAGARCFDTCFLTCEIYSVTCLKFDQKALAHPRSLEGGPCKRKVLFGSTGGRPTIRREIKGRVMDSPGVASVHWLVTTLARIWPAHGRGRSAGAPPCVTSVACHNTYKDLAGPRARPERGCAPLAQDCPHSSHTVATQ